MACWVSMLLSGCASSTAPVQESSPNDGKAASHTPDSYLVVRGDTLYGIAWRYGLNYREIAAWNRLTSPDRIYAGQRLRLKPPAAIAPPPPKTQISGGQPPSSSHTLPTAPPAEAKPSETQSTRIVSQIPWSWPTDGKIIHGYQPDIPGGKGIDIGGRLGQAVRAASPGQVVYTGSGLPGYGRLIIVKHSDSLLSAYGYLGKFFVKEGDKVEIGQFIAELGASNENLPLLHFEIRQNGKPVNPLLYLPVNSAGGAA